MRAPEKEVAAGVRTRRQWEGDILRPWPHGSATSPSISASSQNAQSLSWPAGYHHALLDMEPAVQLFQLGCVDVRGCRYTNVAGLQALKPIATRQATWIQVATDLCGITLLYSPTNTRVHIFGNLLF